MKPKASNPHYQSHSHEIVPKMNRKSDRNSKKRRQSDIETLPLGWTRISRQRQGVDLNKNSAEDISSSFVYCCEDPNCRSGPEKLTPNAPLSTSKVLLKGSAVFCLHSLSTKWFQGQFVATSGVGKPIALLAKQRDDVDDCLQCADHGYREIDLTIFSRFCDLNGEREQVKLEKIPCTGGDMLRMSDEESCLIFDAQRILTGIKAVPLVEKYFRNIIPNLDVDESLLDVLPEVAIVIGDMTLSLEKEFVEKNNCKNRQDSVEIEDGWLSN